MINKHLERELKNIISKHEVFEVQTYQDLNSIDPFLKNNKISTEVLIEFDDEKIANSRLLYTFPYNSYENNLIWDQFIAIQVMKKLRIALNLDYDYDLEEQEQIIYNSSKETYFNYEKDFTSSNDIKTLISMVNTPIRLHFLIKWYRSECLFDALSTYLENNLPFTTMIYSGVSFNVKKLHQPEHIEKELPNYVLFNKFETGKSSVKIEIKEKQKVKRYEEV